MRLPQLILLFLLAFTAVGCDMGGGEDFNKPIAIGKKKKKQRSNVIKKKEEPKPQAPKLLPGEALVKIGSEEMNFRACYLFVIKVDPLRGTVLQLKSYPAESSRDQPSVFFVQARIPGNEISKLSGEEVPAEVFIKQRKTGVWSTLESKPAKLKIKYAESKFTFELAETKMVNSQSGLEERISASFSPAQIMP